MANSSFREITFAIPLDTPLESDAFIAERPGADWRLICVPGTPCRKSQFIRLLRLAPEWLEVVVISRPGFGKGHVKPVLDFHDQAKAVLPFLGEKNTILLGISYGGAIALTAALDFGDEIQGVMTGAALVTEPFDYARFVADLGEYDWLSRLVPQQLRHTSEEIRGRRTQINPLLERLSLLDMPAEILHGNLDTLVSRQDAHKLIDAIGENAHFEEILGGTHYLELQMPNRILNAAKRLIARIE